jgi:Galactosyltransferase
MKRVLCLVLSTDKQWYERLADTSRQTWDAQEVEGVETIFYFGRSSQPSTDKILYTDVDDDFYNMGRKTLAAFEHALAHRQFDYIFRPNASLYVDKPGLLRYAQNWTTENLALGVVAECGEFHGKKFPFLWGPSYMLSRDVAQKVVSNQNFWEHRMMDDLAISHLLHEIGVPLNNRGSMASVAIRNGYEFVYYENGVGGGATMPDLTQLRERLPGQFAFRVKDDANRENDVRLMKELHAVFNPTENHAICDPVP